jgi:hypothetical protein
MSESSVYIRSTPPLTVHDKVPVCAVEEGGIEAGITVSNDPARSLSKAAPSPGNVFDSTWEDLPLTNTSVFRLADMRNSYRSRLPEGLPRRELDRSSCCCRVGIAQALRD